MVGRTPEPVKTTEPIEITEPTEATLQEPEAIPAEGSEEGLEKKKVQ